MTGQEPSAEVEPGVLLRSDAAVLADDTVVPPGNLVRPAPNHFTHVVIVDEPYRFEHPDMAGAEPDGVLPAGERVLLAVKGAERCRVINGAGLYVDVRRASLRRLS